MKDHMTISTLQLTMLVTSMLAASNMISLPMGLTQVAGQDAWFAFFIPIPYGIGLAYLLWRLARAMPQKNIYEISQTALGHFVGGVLNLLLIAYLCLDLISNLRMFSDFFSSSILLKTPPEFIVLLTMLLLIYIATGTMEHLGRANVIIIMIFSSYILLPILLLNEIDLNKLQPVLSGGIMNPIKSGIMASASFGDVIAIGAFLHHVKKPRDIYFAVKVGVILSALMLTVWLFTVVSALSPILASRLIYIGWILVQQIHITDFLDRVDLIIMSMYIPVILIKFSVIYSAILTGIASYTKRKNYRYANVLTGLFLAILTDILFNNSDEVSLFSNYGLIPITFTVQIIYLGSLVIASSMHRRITTPLLKEKRTGSGYGKGVWLAIAGCSASIVFGSIFGHLRGAYGIASALTYVIFLLLCVYLCLREYSKTIIKDV